MNEEFKNRLLCLALPHKNSTVEATRDPAFSHRVSFLRPRKARRVCGRKPRLPVTSNSIHFILILTKLTRKPRCELSRQVTPSLVGHNLSKYKYGLNLTSKRGEKWIPYGDGKLFDEKSGENYEMAVAAVQASLNHIFDAFEKPHETSSYRVTDYIIFVDPKAKNNPAMFQVKDGILVRRTDLENLGDFTTTSNWFGIENVMKVRSYSPRGSVIGE